MEMDMERMDFPENSFRGIFCETAIAHIRKKDIPSLLASFRRVLTPDGLLLVTFRKGNGFVYWTA